jgi:prepilin-type N-terminal cleavage/methylation domain-containing protein
MMFRKLGLINKSQKGVTMIELLATFAVMGIISAGVTTTLYQVVTGNARANNHMIAVNQVQNAGYWVSYDAQLIQQEPAIVKNGSQLESFTFTWTNWNNAESTITYTLDGTELRREGDGQQSIVAQFIDPAGTNIEFADTNGDGAEDTVIFTVTVTIGSGSQQQSETREYRIVPRPGL